MFMFKYMADFSQYDWYVLTKQDLLQQLDLMGIHPAGRSRLRKDEIINLLVQSLNSTPNPQFTERVANFLTRGGYPGPIERTGSPEQLRRGPSLVNPPITSGQPHTPGPQVPTPLRAQIPVSSPITKPIQPQPAPLQASPPITRPIRPQPAPLQASPPITRLIVRAPSRPVTPEATGVITPPQAASPTSPPPVTRRSGGSFRQRRVVIPPPQFGLSEEELETEEELQPRDVTPPRLGREEFEAPPCEFVETGPCDEGFSFITLGMTKEEAEREIPPNQRIYLRIRDKVVCFDALELQDYFTRGESIRPGILETGAGGCAYTPEQKQMILNTARRIRPEPGPSAVPERLPVVEPVEVPLEGTIPPRGVPPLGPPALAPIPVLRPIEAPVPPAEPPTRERTIIRGPRPVDRYPIVGREPTRRRALFTEEELADISEEELANYANILRQELFRRSQRP